MSDATFLVRSPQEPLTTFAERIRRACREAAVTSVEIYPIPPGIAVALFAEVEQDEKSGEVVPAGPRIDLMLVQMGEAESVKQFNGRLATLCTDEEVTSADIRLVDGLPLVALYAESEPDEENADEQVPAADLVQVRVCRANGKTADEAARTETYMEKIFDAASGAVVDLQVAEHAGKAYSMVAYAEAPGDEAEDDEAETKTVDAMKDT